MRQLGKYMGEVRNKSLKPEDYEWGGGGWSGE